MAGKDKPPECPRCSSGKYLRVVRVRLSWICECLACGSLYTFPSPQPNYTRSDADSRKNFQIYKDVYWPKRINSGRRFLKDAAIYSQVNRLLDVGSGWGFFLDEARNQGWQVQGIEIAQDQAEWARSNLGLDIRQSFNQLQEAQFDVITLWDVLEHIPDTFKILEDCRRCLRSGGLLFIKTPNAAGLTAKPAWWNRGFFLLYSNLVYPANPYEHIYHFTFQFLHKELQDAAFSVVHKQFFQDWNEMVFAGRNKTIELIRTMAMWIAYKRRLPYEMSIWAEKNL